jgi:uncharacterized phosphatase
VSNSFLFVRHGKSLANAAGLVGTPDSPLAEEGLKQAQITGQDLRSQNIATILCSPFIRAQQTAEIIAGELGVPLTNIVIIDELHERRMGELEGQPKRHDTQFFYSNDTDLGFEPQDRLISRLSIALEIIRSQIQRSTGRVVVVGHATSGFYLMQIAQGKTTFAEFDPVNQISNAEFVRVEMKTMGL